MTVFVCRYCQYSTPYQKIFARHNSSEKHKNNVLSEEWELPDEPVVTTNYECGACEYSTIHRSNFDRHLKSIAHCKEVGIHKIRKTKEKTQHICMKCNIIYLTRSGLWKHEKICDAIPDNKMDRDEEDANTFISHREIIELLFKENKEFKQLIIEQGKQMLELAKHQGSQPNNSNNTTNNSHNTTNKQKFNLNFFLNETCKDAINFKDFMNSIQVTLLDLEKTAQLGYVDGISRIFIDALKNTDMEHRPIHCTDTKRDSVYIKDGDKWDKDTNQQKLKHAVNYISDRNLGQIQNWKKENPEWEDSDDPKSEVLSALYVKSMATNPEKDEKKILYNILNRVVVEKDESK